MKFYAILFGAIFVSLFTQTESFSSVPCTSPKDLSPSYRTLLRRDASGKRPCRSSPVSPVYARNIENDDVVLDNKDCIRCPATSLLNWREYRARLIKGETPLMMRRASTRSGLWAHEIPQLEAGCLLIETGHGGPQSHPEVAAEEESALDRRVVFLARHDPVAGSHGLILNKPTPFAIGDVTDRLAPFQDNTIHYGGEGRNVLKGVGAHRELHVLHSVAGVRGAAPVVEGVYVGASLAHAAALVARRLARPGQFKFFYSNSRWEPGQLEAEVAEGKWIAAACSKELVLNGASHWEKPLWRLVLEVMGGRHGLISREQCGEL